MGPGTASPCSSRSAINRKASACTAAVACFRVRPYAVTPGSAAMSASQRPSSSRKYSIASEKPVGDFGMTPSCHQSPGPWGLLSWITRYLNKTNWRAPSGVARHEQPKAEMGAPPETDRTVNRMVKFQRDVEQPSRRCFPLALTGSSEAPEPLRLPSSIVLVRRPGNRGYVEIRKAAALKLRTHLSLN